MNNDRILINRLKSFENINSNLLNVVLAVFGTLLLALSSKVQVPFWPVPMTMQTFIVFLIGMAYGWKLALTTLAAYLIEGALGLPVFAKGGGMAYLSGPTAGYLYGMVFAAGLIGFFSERGFAKSYLYCFFSLFVGTAIIFLFGVGYLASIIGYEKAISAGLLPFILSEFFKIALAVAIIPTIWKYKNNQN